MLTSGQVEARFGLQLSDGVSFLIDGGEVSNYERAETVLGDGYTRESKDLFTRHRDLIPNADVVILAYTHDPVEGVPGISVWNFYTYVANLPLTRNGRAICSKNPALKFGGFSWGYAGEGPRGLSWLFEQLGFAPVSPGDLPPAHKEGCWLVRWDGTVQGVGIP